MSGRGLAYWTDGKGDDRVIYISTGYRLVELNARNGVQITSFADGGILDLKVGVVKGTGQQIDLETGEIGVHSTPIVVKDVVIVGSAMKEGMTITTHNNTKGLVRAFDVRTGKKIWQFNTIPKPGEFGGDTWENNSWAENGNTGVWTQITVDEELGLVYLPVESPSSDYYGGHRPGNNLFGESLVCVDLKDRPAEVAFPVRPSSDLGHGYFVRADSSRHQCQRPGDQSGRGAEQAMLAVCVRSRERPARLADRRASGAAIHRSGREVVADAALSHQAARVLPKLIFAYRTISSTSRRRCARRPKTTSRATP